MRKRVLFSVPTSYICPLIIGLFLSLNLIGVPIGHAQNNNSAISEIRFNAIPFSVSQSSIDVTSPIVTITSPENMTYLDSFVLLDFFVNEQYSWVGYSLDGQENVTITDDIILINLSKGPHYVVVYATDFAGNIGLSEVVHFSISQWAVDVTPPQITINSPENKTYDFSEVLIDVDIDETVSWIQYKLDGQDNVTIDTSLVLTDLINGSHSLIIYAEDLSGNIGNSNLIYFEVSIPLEKNLDLLVVATIVTIICVGFGFTLYVSYDAFKNR